MKSGDIFKAYPVESFTIDLVNDSNGFYFSIDEVYLFRLSILYDATDTFDPVIVGKSAEHVYSYILINPNNNFIYVDKFKRHFSNFIY